MTWAMRLNGGDLAIDGEEVRHETPGGAFYVRVIKDGTGFGNREPLTRTINTLMTQGSWEVIDQFANRAPALVIEIEGETGDGLNAGEVWLSDLMKPGSLEWLPPRQSVWTVFDVVSCYIDRTEDGDWDLDEDRWIRVYRVPIKALPHARSQQLTVTPAQPAGEPVDVLVTDGSTAAGWRAGWSRTAPSPAGGTLTPTVVSGAVRATYPDDDPAVRNDMAVFLEYDFGSVVPAETPYLQVDLRRVMTTPNSYTAIATTADGERAMVHARQSTEANLGGNVRAVTLHYLLPAGTTKVRITATTPQVSNFAPTYVEVDQVRRQSRLPESGTGRQKVASLYPGGSAPTDGSLHVSHPTDALGKVIVATYPLGRPSPALMQYRTALSQTALVEDATMINGARWQIQTQDLELTVPDAALPTRGLAALWVKISHIVAITVRWTIQPLAGGVAVGTPQTGEVAFTGAGQQLVPLGLVDLPGWVVGPDGAVRITFERISSTGGVAFDEVYAFGQDEYSGLTIVDAGSGAVSSGGASNQLWVNAPSVDHPAGEVLIGTNFGDARWPSTIRSTQVHKFPRDGVSVLTATLDAVDALTDLTHYMRWTHHAAKPK